MLVTICDSDGSAVWGLVVKKKEMRGPGWPSELNSRDPVLPAEHHQIPERHGLELSKARKWCPDPDLTVEIFPAKDDNNTEQTLFANRDSTHDPLARRFPSAGTQKQIYNHVLECLK